MKLYKYRTLSASGIGIERVERIIRRRAVWCAAPASLNDCQEFSWTCEFTASLHTSDLLADLLVKLKGWPVQIARQLSRDALSRGGLREVAEPVINEMIQKARAEVGVASFGTSADNSILWERYGGDGAGLCIEFDLPDSALGTRIHPVVYDDRRTIHVDDFLRSRFESRYAEVVYSTLLTKTTSWTPEQEIRFLSRRQEVEVVIDDAAVTRVVVGQDVSPADFERVQRIEGNVLVVRREVKDRAAAHPGIDRC